MQQNANAAGPQLGELWDLAREVLELRSKEAWLATFLSEMGSNRITVSEVAEIAHYLGERGGDVELIRFLQARAENSERGRPLSAKTVDIREQVLALQGEYEQMTVRQVFYRLMTRGVVPKSEQHGYDPIQRQVLALRRQGFLPWAFIADGTRWVREPQTWDDTEDFLREQARLYRVNRWRSQGVRLEVWLEKDALASVIAPTTYAFGVPLMVSRGQSSDTYCWAAAQEAKAAWKQAQTETVVFTLYDSDKSGRAAEAAIERKLHDYSDGAPITVERLAVTDEQIQSWQLPTRPAKEAGEPDAVELDAIDPAQLTGLVGDAITDHIDAEAWAQEQVVEESERKALLRLAGVEDGDNG